MSSGYTVSGKGDLDDIFDAYDGGTKPAKTGITVGSQDLRDRYSPLAEGEQISFDTGYAVGSQDLRKIFAGKGTSSQAQVIGFGNYRIESHDSHDAGGAFNLDLKPDGKWSISMSYLHTGSTSGSPTSGNWHRTPASGVGSDYEVRITAHITPSGTTPPTFTGTSGWQRLSTTRSVSVTGHVLGGGTEEHSGWAIGTYDIEIRKRGSTVIRKSVLNIDFKADAM